MCVCMHVCACVRGRRVLEETNATVSTTVDKLYNYNADQNFVSRKVRRKAG